MSSPTRPRDEEHFLLTVLVQQTAGALSNAFSDRLRLKSELARDGMRDELDTARQQLNLSLSDVEHQKQLREALARSAAAGDGERGIAEVLHSITGLPTVVEDPFGNLKAWAGPGCPAPYPKPDPARREEMLHDAARRLHPLRVKDRLVALACPQGEVLGVLALVDPEARADEHALLALEHAATFLSLEQAHLRNTAEIELRLRRELVGDLITGTDEASAYARSEAEGHDLHGPHCVIAVQWDSKAIDDSFLNAVSRTSARLGMRSLVSRHSGIVIMVTLDRPGGHELHDALSRELGSADGSIGVGSRCDSPVDLPRSYQESLRALEVRRRSRTREGTTFFDELGLYRLLGAASDYEEVDRFLHEWLGPLLDYDSRHRTELVETLSQYFECAGNYDETAAELAIHRSTLRYRLQRIRQISGSDLAAVDSRLNLQVATLIWKITAGHEQ